MRFPSIRRQIPQMDGENPYAPPLTLETEFPVSRPWRIEGISVLVKNQAALPMVDLNTGEHDGNLKCVRRTLWKSSPASFFVLLPILGVYLVIKSGYRVDPVTIVIVSFLGVFILKQIQALRGSPSRSLHVMEYLGKKSLQRATRAKIRRGINLLYIILFLVGTMGAFPGVSVLPVGILVILGCWIWAIFDRPPASSLPGPPGWMKISPVHHEALRFLSALEAETRAENTAEWSPRSKVRTTFYYKFPLAILIGRRRNPLAIFNIAMAKLLRSHLFKRDTYHFSESVPVDLADLCEPLREDMASWIAAHPDWVFRTGERLPFPDGDIISETARLSPDTFEHELWISRSWHVATPTPLNLQHTFLTWLANGRRVTTSDVPFIRLDDPACDSFRATGDLEQIYQAHLRNAAGKPLDPPQDHATRIARILAVQEETDRRLTGLGYQSELR